MKERLQTVSKMEMEEIDKIIQNTPQQKPRRKKKKQPDINDNVETVEIAKHTDETGQDGVPKIAKRKKKKPVTNEMETNVDEIPGMKDSPRITFPASTSSEAPQKVKRKKKKPVEEQTVPASPESLQTTDKDNLLQAIVHDPPQKTKRKKKKPTTSPTEDQVETEQAELPLSSEEQVAPETPKKLNKKKKKIPKEESEIVENAETVTTVDKDVVEEDAVTTETPRKMKRKKKKGEKKEEEIISEDKQEAIEAEDDGRILSVTLHRTDKLKNDFYIMHPLIRVHIIDENTGNYLVKQHHDRAVISYFETQNEKLDNILPIMTQPFDFRQQKSTIPVWEETVIFNENFNYFIQKNLNVIVFFELLDFVSMNRASIQYSNAKQSGGWHRIAWAFLRLVGSNGELNVGKKVRLQLFEPPTGSRPKPGQVEIFQWWNSTQRKPYPSTLYVTLKGITSPNMVEPSSRSMFATQEELGRMTFEDLNQLYSGTHKREESKVPATSWNRLYGQTCQIPNTHMLSLPAAKKGCFVLKFSHDGRHLACGCRDIDTYPIYIYEIPSGKLQGEFSGHFGIIYDLCWSKRNSLLLSASSDGTARIWDLQEFGDEAMTTLPHPAFVYSAQFHPVVDSIVVTGAFDQVLRVWDIEGDDQDSYLKQEIEDHQGHVNSLCFDEEGEKLYSADSKGIIFVWNVFVTERTSRRAFVTDWTKYQEIKDPALTDVPINCLKMHPSGRKLLVHCRDNIIRMFDLRVQRIIQNYFGAINFREKIRSTISPCGTLVFSGSEDNIAYVWNVDSGDQVAKYSDLSYQQPLTDVEYHPKDHIVAFCSFGENQPVLLYNYSPDLAIYDAGIVPKPQDLSLTKKDDVMLMSTRSIKTSTKKTTLPEPADDVASTTRSLVHDRKDFHNWVNDRYQRVMQKLDSVTLGDPGLLSPHAPMSMSGTMQQHQFNTKSMYMAESDGSWRPNFSEVGHQSTARLSHGKPPPFYLDTSQGKAEFSFIKPAGKEGTLKKVVAIYDYKAQRSDELSIFKGDVIMLLFKDSDSWWMGQLPNGQTGYFPSNYVTESK